MADLILIGIRAVLLFMTLWMGTVLLVNIQRGHSISSLDIVVPMAFFTVYIASCGLLGSLPHG